MSVSIEQIRAGRALINFSQKELAEHAGISLNSLNNIERGVASPRADSLNSIQKALEDEGVEFLEGNGVRLTGELLKIEKIEGTDVIDLLEQFYSEFLKTFHSKSGEILYIGIDNSRFQHLSKEKLQVYKKYEQEFIKRGIDERLLFKEDDINFISERNNYRWVPKELFGEIPMAIYGDNISIILWGPPSRMVIIRNAAIAETFRKQFDVTWSMGKEVPDEIHAFHKVKDEDWK
jgi:transcriptional regulator with XRE-family HTH domain